MTPSIEIVIPVHSAERPIARAVSSCFAGNDAASVSVTVVCHNIDKEIIAYQLADVSGPLRLLELKDGVHSPAGPLNYGLKSATADYVGVMGSDDFFEPGALDKWRLTLAHTGAGILVAPLKHQSGEIVRTPRVRPGRVHSLDPVRDRLAYATAPLGVWKRDLSVSGPLSFEEGLRTGEDLGLGLRLWFSGQRIERPNQGFYVIGADATDRVTTAVLPLEQEFEAVNRLDWGFFESLTIRERRAIAIKLARVQLLAALFRRGSGADWNESDTAAAELFACRLNAFAPGFSKPLPAADFRLFHVLGAGSLSTDLLVRSLAEYERESYRNRVLCRSVWTNLHPESTVRHLLRLKLYRRDR